MKRVLPSIAALILMACLAWSGTLLVIPPAPAEAQYNSSTYLHQENAYWHCNSWEGARASASATLQASVGAGAALARVEPFVFWSRLSNNHVWVGIYVHTTLGTWKVYAQCRMTGTDQRITIQELGLGYPIPA